MATYFHGSSEIQAATPDGIQTLYLMNPNYISSYSDSTQYHHHQQQQEQASNMLLFNPTVALNPTNHPHAPPPPNHNLVGIPLPTDHENQGRSSSLHGVIPTGIQYNLWSSLDHNQQVTSVTTTTDSPVGVSSIRESMMMSPARQGLSLSLNSPHQQAQAATSGAAAFRAISNEHESQAMHGSLVSAIKISGNSPPSMSAVSNGVSGMQNMALGSKYLKAAQELLDEVVNVEKAIKSDLTEGINKEKMKMNKESMTAGDGSGSGGGSGGGGGGDESGGKHVVELTAAQRQELQMKKAKLVNMFDEVEQRYKQYHNQMQIVVSSFEQAAGFGAATSYTALALQTISKQFRCLKDAISGQIKATSKALGEDDCLGVKVEGSRLRYVDNQLRQQRAFQQLGMIHQHNAWRPQRGLPERAVSILRAWLFEHFLHPYPKDSDKQMLAKQTGLTRSQVSNWFINARVRLWKPMVEEMYLEEMKENEKNGSDENSGKNENKDASEPRESSTIQMGQLKAVQLKAEKSMNQIASSTEFSNSSISMSAVGRSIQQQPGFTVIRATEMEGIVQRSPNKPKNNDDMNNSPSSILSMDMDMKFQGETSREITMSFGGYPMGDLGRFNPEQLAPRFNGNGVSLTLGLPQQNFVSNQNIQLGRRLEIGNGEPDFCGISTSQNSHSPNGFENVDIQNRKSFAAQLLPDFVA